ncbi:MAG: rhamnan synthesis F family protein [Kiritimatiellae bacterium]|nr:rhamnan synthesis F family protein [Kiritimatiellia bacterium]
MNAADSTTIPAPAPPTRSRIGIFLTHDPEGSVDDYIVFLLRDMMQNLSRLVVVVNGTLSDEGWRRLSEFTGEIYVRPNEGFDVGAWQEALAGHVGYDRLADYDDLVLFNDSFFGPLYPFATVFAEMDRRGHDFWGLSVHGETPGTGLCPYGNRPRYLQTYFLVFGKRVLSSNDFRAFWQDLPRFRHFDELADRFAAVLTRHFADRGFAWSAYCETADLEGPPVKNFDPHTYALHELVAHRKYPVIKRRSFLVSRTEYLRHCGGAELRATVEHVRRHSNYDLRLVFRHLLRRYDPGALKESLGLDYVFATDDAAPALPTGRRIAVVAHLFYPDQFERCAATLCAIPPEIDLIITTDTEEKRSQLEALVKRPDTARTTILQVEPRGRDWGAFLAGCRPLLADHDYLCFVHDKTSPQKEYATVGAAFRELLWENMLASPGYVRRIVAAFEADPSLGLLVPPPPMHGTYFKSSMDAWTVCYEATCRLADRLGLPAHPGRQRSPIAVGSVFWCRTAALEPLLAAPWKYADFPAEPLPHDGTLNHALERILPYVAQARGFLTGWTFTEPQAAAFLANATFMLDATRRALNGTPGLRFATFASFLASLRGLRRVLRCTGLQYLWPTIERGSEFLARRCPCRLRGSYTRLRLRTCALNGAGRRQ